MTYKLNMNKLNEQIKILDGQLSILKTTGKNLTDAIHYTRIIAEHNSLMHIKNCMEKVG